MECFLAVDQCYHKRLYWNKIAQSITQITQTYNSKSEILVILGTTPSYSSCNFCLRSGKLGDDPFRKLFTVFWGNVRPLGNIAHRVLGQAIKDIVVSKRY